MSTSTSATAPAAAAAAPEPFKGKSGKKICCACRECSRERARHARARSRSRTPNAVRAAWLSKFTPRAHRAPHPLPPSAADTRKPRDLCVVERGEEHCRPLIEAHDACLRLDGFTVPLKSWQAGGGAAAAQQQH